MRRSVPVKLVVPSLFCDARYALHLLTRSALTGHATRVSGCELSASMM